TAMLAAYRGKTKLPSTAGFLKMVNELTQAPKGGKSKGAKGKAKKKSASAPMLAKTGWTEYERLAMQRAAADGLFVYHVITQVDPNCAMPIAARQLVLNAASSIGEVLGVRPEDKSSAPTKQLEVLLASQHAQEAVSAKCRIPTVISTVDIEVVLTPQQTGHSAAVEGSGAEDVPAHSDEPSTESAAEEAQGPSRNIGTAADNILRVDAERIDSVLNLVGELIIGKSMLQQALNELVADDPKHPVRGKFVDAMGFQARVLNDLQRSVMKIRMVPVEQLFRRFPRVVRDVARQCGKDVSLVI